MLARLRLEGGSLKLCTLSPSIAFTAMRQAILLKWWELNGSPELFGEWLLSAGTDSVSVSTSSDFDRFLRRCVKSCVSVARPLKSPETAATTPNEGPSAPSYVSEHVSELLIFLT